MALQCDGRCQCPECNPTAFPNDGRRQNPGHTAVRWGDYGCRVWLDGEEVTRQCFESMAGDYGYVVAFRHDSSGKKHVCSCGRGMCSAVVAGRVSVTRVYVAPWLRWWRQARLRLQVWMDAAALRAIARSAA